MNKIQVEPPSDKKKYILWKPSIRHISGVIRNPNYYSLIIPLISSQNLDCNNFEILIKMLLTSAKQFCMGTSNWGTKFHNKDKISFLLFLITSIIYFLVFLVTKKFNSSEESPCHKQPYPDYSKCTEVRDILEETVKNLEWWRLKVETLTGETVVCPRYCRILRVNATCASIFTICVVIRSSSSHWKTL